MPSKSLPSSKIDLTSRSMRSSWHCASGECREAAARCRVLSLVKHDDMVNAFRTDRPDQRGSSDA